MLCIEFLSASPADVRGPQVVDLCNAARAFLPTLHLKKVSLKHTHTQPHMKIACMPITCKYKLSIKCNKMYL